MQRPLLSFLGIFSITALCAQEPTLIRTINPGGGAAIEQITCLGSAAWMSANDGTHGQEPWTSDGTTAGTQLLKDIAPGTGDSDPGPFVQFNGSHYFGADNGVDGEQLFASDGTSAGTQVWLNLGSVPDLNYGYYFTQYNGRLYFQGHTDANGRELWVTDGTLAGTTLLKDIAAGTGNGDPRGFTVFNGRLYFSAKDANGEELWATDGTAQGTQLVVDIRPSGSSSPTGLAVSGDHLFFSANDGIAGNEPWMSDGTTAGTHLVKDVEAGDFGSNPGGYTAYNGRVWFSALSPEGYRLWYTDGTEAGTQQLPDPAQVPIMPDAMLAYNGLLYFTASNASVGSQLWRSDGTTAGTYPLLMPGGASNALSHTHHLVGCNGHLLFLATYDEAVGEQLYGLEAPVGIAHQGAREESLHTYPDPTEGSFTCTVPPDLLNAPVRLFDATGALVRTMGRAQSTTLQRDLGDLAPGRYVLEVGTAEQARRGVVVRY
jgi:ELWxxDGT repeat protein